MQPETRTIEAQQTNPQNIVECPNCHAILPTGMFFCRICGHRLSESEWSEAATAHLNQPATFNPATPAGGHWEIKRRRGPHWIVWVVLGAIVFSFIGGAIISATKRFLPPQFSSAPAPPESRVGISDFTTIENDGGAMLESVDPPDSPADKAGLIGGDIITSYDGKPVKDENSLRRMISSTPVGKTVEVIYTRDGEPKKTNLTTVNEDEIDRLDEVFDRSPKGQLGVDDLERVPVAVEGKNIYGVRVGDISKNRAAYFAEMKEGDIIIEFNGTPIRTREELGQRIDRAKPRSTVKIVIMREKEKLELTAKIGED
jgi:S1-C subfamily serine protease